MKAAKPYKRSLKLLLEVSTLFILGVAGLCAYSDLAYSPVAEAKSATASYIYTDVSAKHSVKETGSVTVNTDTAPTPTTPAPVENPPVPECRPDTSYALPSQLTLTQAGINQVIDLPYTYTVYGNSGAEVLNQIARCTPVHSTNDVPGTYAASTAYAINWQFDYTGDGGTCTLSNVRVGLHINQVFPAWQSSGTDTFESNWQSYITKLHMYENGHVELDEAAANKVLDDLSNFPPTDCTKIVQAANKQASSDVQSYDTANYNYDISNKFGLNQSIEL